MGIAEDITVTLRQAGIYPGPEAHQNGAMRRGWDYWFPNPPISKENEPSPETRKTRTPHTEALSKGWPEARRVASRCG